MQQKREQEKQTLPKLAGFKDSAARVTTDPAGSPREPHKPVCRVSVDPFKVISELASHALGKLPAVFILDNVHLMDKMSWKLLIQVSRSGYTRYNT